MKSVKLSVDEQAFIKQYRELEDIEREKGIKFFQCVGDPPHSQSFVDKVKDKREKDIKKAAEEMRQEDCARFMIEADRDKVMVDPKVGSQILSKPRWDAFTNNHFSMRRRLVSIFLRVANKLIIRLRAGKRLTMIREWIEINGVHTREDMRIRVNEDYKQA